MILDIRDAADPTRPLDEQLRVACGEDASIFFDRDVAPWLDYAQLWVTADTKVTIELEHVGRRYFGVYVKGSLVAIWDGTQAVWARRDPGEDADDFRRRAFGRDADPVGDVMRLNKFREWTYGPIAPAQMACIHFPNCRTPEEHDARNVEQAALLAANYRAFDDDADRDEED